MTTCFSDNPPSALIKISGTPGKSATSTIPCAFHGMQGKCLVVETREELVPGMAITVECDDALFLGEVVTATSVAGNCRLEIKVEQILTGLQSLMALRAQLLNERAPIALATAPLCK